MNTNVIYTSTSIKGLCKTIDTFGTFLSSNTHPKKLLTKKI